MIELGDLLVYTEEIPYAESSANVVQYSGKVKKLDLVCFYLDIMLARVSITLLLIMKSMI